MTHLRRISEARCVVSFLDLVRALWHHAAFGDGFTYEPAALLFLSDALAAGSRDAIRVRVGAFDDVSAALDRLVEDRDF